MPAAEQGLEDALRAHLGLLAFGIILLASAWWAFNASQCHLNPDEAMHFVWAHAPDLPRAYRRSLNLAHPPLLVLVLHGVLQLGDSELLLRVPSLLAMAGALGLAFAWMRRAFGPAAALAGLLVLACSPAAASAASEARQYGLLLLGLCGALYAQERLLAGGRGVYALPFVVFLGVAILSHYSAVWAVVALGVSGLARLARLRPRASAVLGWVAAQLGAGLLYLWLYATHVRFLAGGLRSAVAEGYLSAFYFDPGQASLPGFVGQSLWGAFGHLVRVWDPTRASAGPPPPVFVGLLVLLFGAGVVTLLFPGRGRDEARPAQALLLLLPPLLGCLGAVAGWLPFGASRHVSFLLPFVAAGVGLAVAAALAGRLVPVLVVACAVAPLWIVFSPPANRPEGLSRERLGRALEQLEASAPPDALVFVDEQSRWLLAYYWARDLPDLRGQWKRDPGPPVWEARWRGRRVVSLGFWGFRPGAFRQQLAQLARLLGLAPGAPVHVFSAGWGAANDFPGFADTLLAAGEVSGRRFGSTSVLETRAPDAARPGGG